METLSKLIALAALSSLATLTTVIIFTNADIPFQYVAFSVNLVFLAITGVAFSTLTSIDVKMENLRLREKLAKWGSTAIKSLVDFLKAREENAEKVDIQGIHTDIHIDTFPVEDNINPRTKKPYKMSAERRQALREKALEREQNKRIAKTTAKSTARKVAKKKKSI